MVKSALTLTALLFSSAVYAAPGSMDKVNTAKGEMLLEVTANGTASAKIIKVSASCEMKASAESKNAAMALLEKQQSDLTSALRDAGLSSAKLDFTAPAILSTEATAAMDAAVAADAAMAVASKSSKGPKNTMPKQEEPIPSISAYTRRVGLSTSSATEMRAIGSMIEQFGCTQDNRSFRNPLIELENPEGAKASAAKTAITSAKLQADNYAATLNMKVVRLLRVSEVGAIKELLGPGFEDFLREIKNDRGRQNPAINEMPVSATISVDFVLGPK